MFLLILSGCIENTTQKTVNPVKLDVKQTPGDSLPDTLTHDHQKTSEDANPFVNIQEVNSNIWVDLKYRTRDNFMGFPLYDTIQKAYLQKDVADRLGRVQHYLTKLKPGYHLLVYDAVRPLSVQQEMWDALDSIPVARRGKFVSNPKNHSIHNYGAAVDLTIVNEQGIPLDMGAKYDEIGEIAYPSKELMFLEKGLLTQQQVANRQLLRKVMAAQKFQNIPSEWWHFNACTRTEAKQRYQILVHEF